MLARRSRKMRIQDPPAQPEPFLPSILRELTTPGADGSIPLENFLGNTEKFIEENADLNLRVAQLEEENAKYKQLFRQYEDKMTKIENVINILAEDDDRFRTQHPPAGFRVKNPIYNYFGHLPETDKKPVELLLNKKEPAVESKLAKNIDELLRTNIDLMISQIQKIKGTYENGTHGSLLNPPSFG